MNKLDDLVSRAKALNPGESTPTNCSHTWVSRAIAQLRAAGMVFVSRENFSILVRKS